MIEQPVQIDAVLLAKIIALTARNGVETLHAEGAFSDRQAPALNRRLRGRIYEFLIALERCDPDSDDEPFIRYLRELAGNDYIVPAFAALRALVGRAVDDFAVAEGIDKKVAAALKREAAAGAGLGFKTWLELRHGQAETQRAIAYWGGMVPDYWEDPVVRPEFSVLLVGEEDPGAYERPLGAAHARLSQPRRRSASQLSGPRISRFRPQSTAEPARR